jgi:hypothetical protein
MTDELAKRLLDTVIFVTEKYWGYSLLDICGDIIENNKLTAEELVNCLTPVAYAQLTHELREKYLNKPHLKKLIVYYETFLKANKKA